MSTITKKHRDAADDAMEETDAKFDLPAFIEHWLNSEHNGPATDNTMSSYPDLERNQVEKIVHFERICDSYTGWIERAMWRRVATNDLTEFSKFLLMQGRQGVICYEPDDEFDDECTDLYNVLMPLLAVNDMSGLERYLAIAQFEPKSTQTIPMLYCAVGAILNGTIESETKFIDRTTPKSDSAAMSGMIDAVKGILKNDVEQFTTGLTLYVENYRRQFLFEYQKPYSVEAIGLYQLAKITNSDLVDQFDVSMKPPWDADFHHWIESNAARLESEDFGNCPDEYADPFLTIERPAWYPKNDER